MSIPTPAKPAPAPLPAGDKRFTPYSFFILGLSLLVLPAMAAEVLLPLSRDSRTILRTLDSFVSVIFFVDFCVCLYRAPNRLRYMVTWGWIDLISSLPALGPLRFGRAARVFRILRLLRGVRAIRLMSGFMMSRRAESAFLTTALISLLILGLASLAVLDFERGLGGNIDSGQDALWWAFVTMTTVGYGEHFPISTEGRVVAAVLMVVGVGVFGTFTGFVATWFLDDDAEQDKARDLAMAEQLRGIEAQLIELRKKIDSKDPP